MSRPVTRRYADPEILPQLAAMTVARKLATERGRAFDGARTRTRRYHKPVLGIFCALVVVAQHVAAPAPMERCPARAAAGLADGVVPARRRWRSLPGDQS